MLCYCGGVLSDVISRSRILTATFEKKAKASVGRIEATDAAIAPGTPGTWSSSQRIAWSVAHDARVRCAVSKGAMLGADKLAKDLRGLAVWIGAGQLHRVLEAQATFLHRGGGATFSKTLT